MIKSELITSLENLIQTATDNMQDNEGIKREYYFGEKMGLTKALVNIRCLED